MQDFIHSVSVFSQMASNFSVTFCPQSSRYLVPKISFCTPLEDWNKFSPINRKKGFDPKAKNPKTRKKKKKVIWSIFHLQAGEHPKATVDSCLILEHIKKQRLSERSTPIDPALGLLLEMPSLQQHFESLKEEMTESIPRPTGSHLVRKWSTPTFHPKRTQNHGGLTSREERKCKDDVC